VTSRHYLPRTPGHGARMKRRLPFLPKCLMNTIF
jgi:hypothetical protein